MCPYDMCAIVTLATAGASTVAVPGIVPGLLDHSDVAQYGVITQPQLGGVYKRRYAAAR
jgi:hypothetical protein